MGIHFFKTLIKRNKSTKKTTIIQTEYVDALTTIMTSSLWDNDLIQLREYLPADLSDDTIRYVYKKCFGENPD